MDCRCSVLTAICYLLQELLGNLCKMAAAINASYKASHQIEPSSRQACTRKALADQQIVSQQIEPSACRLVLIKRTALSDDCVL